MEHDALTTRRDMRPAMTRDGIGDMALRDFLTMHPGVVLEAWSDGDRAVVDLLSVPEWRRREGLGSMAYALWERTLADGMIVHLFCVDERAAAFWRTMGFGGPDNGVMIKRVARHARAT